MIGRRRFSGIMAALLAVCGTSAAAKPADLGSDLQIKQGTLRAAPRDGNGVLTYKGIPYAAPPVAQLRWKAPQPAPNWQGTRDATVFGKRCLSAWKQDREPGPPRSEDCLTINVWTGAATSKDKRPVMVWIHGGGFQFGSATSRQFEGTPLASKGVIVVTLNYRVGVLGFLAHSDLDREGASGNYGLQDQLAALRWVKANIASFGGDPKNVTIFGESAGAHAIGILMVSPLAKGLFQKAIGQSGAFWDTPNGPLESFDEARARGANFAKKLNAGSIADLRAMPAETINAAAPWDFSINPAVKTFSPNVDRYVIPDFPSARYARKQQMRIPLLAGWNEAEEHPFDALGLPHSNAKEFRTAAQAMFGADRMDEFLDLYPADSDAQANTSSAALTGDIVISEQIWQWLEFQKKTRMPVYGYKFSYTSPYTPIASHITEIPFVFGTLTPQFVIGSTAPPAQADRDFSGKLMSYWVNFAKSGNPNGPGLPHWPSFGKGTIQHLAEPIRAQANDREARFRFIASYRQDGVLPHRWRNVSLRGPSGSERSAH